MTDKALQSIIKEAKQIIRRREGRYADSVIADFDDALRSSDNPHKTAYEWLQKYKKPGYRAKRAEQPQRETVKPKAEAQYPKRGHQEYEWTVYREKGNKHAEMWEYSNILTAPIAPSANPKKVQVLVKRKLDTLQLMATKVTSETREHFRMALTACLRVELNQDVRKEVIYMLTGYFGWSEIEWTFWLHGKRRSEDHYMLVAAEAWCKSKYRDAKSLHKAVANATRLLIAETVG